MRTWNTHQAWSETVRTMVYYPHTPEAAGRILVVKELVYVQNDCPAPCGRLGSGERGARLCVRLPLLDRR